MFGPFSPLALAVGFVAMVVVVVVLSYLWSPARHLDYRGCPNCQKAIHKEHTTCPFCKAELKRK